jgi:hypothetical protein
MLESLQAKLVMGFAVVSLVLSAVATGKTHGAITAFVIMIISTLFVLLAVIDVNCTIIGQCNLLGWVKTFFIVMSTILAIYLSIKEITKKPIEHKPENVPKNEVKSAKSTDAKQ